MSKVESNGGSSTILRTVANGVRMMTHEREVSLLEIGSFNILNPFV